MALSDNAKEIAMTAIKQMGGHAALNAMLGLKKTLNAFYLIDEKKNGDVVVQFDFKATNAKNVNRVIITYVQASDLYNMELWKRLTDKNLIDTMGWTREQMAEKFRVANFEGIYCDQLRELFMDTTGLSLMPPALVQE